MRRPADRRPSVRSANVFSRCFASSSIILLPAAYRRGMIEFCQFNKAPSQAMGDDFSLNGSLGSRALSTSRTGFALVYQSDIRLNGAESCWSLATLRPVPHGRPAVSLYLDADCQITRSP